MEANSFHRLLELVCAVAFFLVGALQLISCIRESAEAVTATHWPTVPGTVQSASVLEIKGGRGTAYVPKVTYAYEVAGVKYSGDHIHISDVAEPRERAYLMIEPFVAGAPVSVYFDREDPSRSLLKPGLYWYSGAWFALSVLGIVVGPVLFYFDRARRAD
jgi:hypothetical protein